MDIESKLDEDHLFYMSFANCLDRLKTEEEYNRCHAWLQKLCGEPCIGIKQKRNRNVLLSNLVLCMQESNLTGPFEHFPSEVNIAHALAYFDQREPVIKEAGWLKDSDSEYAGSDRLVCDGRTYLATRTLPDGEGAFAYLAINLNEDESIWSTKNRKERFGCIKEEGLTDDKIEQILMKRKSPEERQKMLTIYDALLQNISDELEGSTSSNNNQTINELVTHLINDLTRKGKFGPYTLMTPEKARIGILALLRLKLESRRRQVAKREEFLDQLESKCRGGAEQETTPQELMWEEAIYRYPKRIHMENLLSTYPDTITQRFLELLSKEKRGIVKRFHNQCNNIVEQIKENSTSENGKERLDAEEARCHSDEAMEVLKNVRAAFTKQCEIKEALTRNRNNEQSKFYKQIKIALQDTYNGVQREVQRGQRLVDQINAMTKKYSTNTVKERDGIDHLYFMQG